MEFDCPKCGKAASVDFPYGDDVTCPHCGTRYSTDCDDKDGEDTLVAWIVSELPPKAT